MSQRRLPAEIYWRRRLLLVAAIIALIWTVMHFASGDDQPTAARRPVATTPAPVPTPTVPVNGTVDVTLVSDSRRCDPEEVRITPSVEAGQVTKGSVSVGLVVSSTASKACTLTAADADLVAVISANGTAVWDSTVCKASLLGDPVALTPRWSTVVNATWSGRGSGSACSSKQGYASAGTYVLQVGTLGGEPGMTKFTLEPRPRPAPTATKATPKTPAPKTTAKPPG